MKDKNLNLKKSRTRNSVNTLYISIEKYYLAFEYALSQTLLRSSLFRKLFLRVQGKNKLFTIKLDFILMYFFV